MVFDITDDIPGEGNAIVLGGGGASGMAWMIGVLAAWEEGGLKASSADTAVGTSGGASVAVVLLQENGLREAFNKLLTPERQPFEVTAEISFDAFAESVGRISKQSAGEKEFLASLFDLARTSTVEFEQRARTIRERIATDEWPDGDLKIPAVSGSELGRKVFMRHDGVSIADAVLASSAVPGVWPMGRVGDEEFIDGGIMSATHCDLAGDRERVIVLRPTTNLGGKVIPEEQPVLGRAFIVEPDEESVKSFGGNVLDPSHRKQAAESGYRQGSNILRAAREYWEGVEIKDGE
ncbi:patatin-like phospholipase family protein [Streptomyces sp. NPDC050529]|uniref:patatin-like phospholipase family protein n=1 Tax=Streptomyces sp. NPDC050529 TaxID=3365624 RepID=UPI00379AEAAE